MRMLHKENFFHLVDPLLYSQIKEVTMGWTCSLNVENKNVYRSLVVKYFGKDALRDRIGNGRLVLNGR